MTHKPDHYGLDCVRLAIALVGAGMDVDEALDKAQEISHQHQGATFDSRSSAHAVLVKVKEALP